MLKHLGTYLAHYAAIIAGAAAVVASYNPTLISAALPFLGSHAAGLVGGAAALVAAFHALGVDPPSQVAKALASALLTTAVGILAIADLTGCSMGVTVSNLQQSAPLIQGAVEIAVATAESKGLQAAQINALAKQALAADQGAAASLNAITEVVNARFAKLNLPPGDVAAALILEDALELAINAKLAENPAAAQTTVIAASVIQDVINVTGG